MAFEKKLSDLTCKVVAFAAVTDFRAVEIIDWALDMLELGYDSPSLLMLCAFDKMASYFELIEYVRKALAELNIKEKSGEEAVASYSSYYVNNIVKSENKKVALMLFYESCIQRLGVYEYDSLFFGFSQLYWAWQDFDYGNKFSYECREATPENIEQLVVAKAQEWLKENEEYLSINGIEK